MIDIAVLKARRTTLHRERDAGQHALAELAAKQTEVRDTTLRIDGAIMVLDELIADGEKRAAEDANKATPTGP